MKPVVFIPERIARPGLDLLNAECTCVAPWAEGDERDAEAHRARLYEADAVLIRLFPIGAPDLAHAPRLKVIARHGVGVDTVDCAAATVRRIPVVYTPGANANAVAEYALALMLALARQVGPASLAIKEGRFSERDRFQGMELAGKTLGIIGLGRIGSRVAEMAHHGLGMTVYGYDPVLGPYTGPAVRVDTLEDLLSRADFLTLHVPLTPDTRHLISAERLRLVKPGCRLINTSRGAVVDETALLHALRTGLLAGAALDVFETEPLPPDHPLCRAPNVLLTPHIAGLTPESLDRVAIQAAQGILDVLHGKRPAHVINPEVFG
jgi:D-3-phosphoglycerate dehydrogenase